MKIFTNGYSDLKLFIDSEELEDYIYQRILKI